MEWFRRGCFLADRILNFNNLVMDLLDPSKYRISKHKLKDRVIWKFYQLPTYFLEADIIIMNNGNVLNERKRNCLKSPYLFAIAIKDKLLISRIPKYKTLVSYKFNDYLSVAVRINLDNDKEVLEIRNKFKSNPRVNYDDCSRINMYFTLYRKLKGLSQFKDKPRRLNEFLRKSMLSCYGKV